MPADFFEYEEAFTNLTGTDSGENFAGHEVAGPAAWIDLFEETGIDFDDHGQQVEAFENFLIAFYPSESSDLSADEWYYLREEFYDLYGIDESDIDWEAYRDAIGYGRS